MILKVRVVPKASREMVKEEHARLKVYLTSPAQEGLANAQLIKVLAKHLKVKKYRLRITQGEKARDKSVEVADE